MTRRSDPRGLAAMQPEPTTGMHSALQSLDARVRRLEDEVRRAVVLANESKQASEDFHRIVTHAVDSQYKHIKGELAQLQTGTSEQTVTLDKQNSTLDMQTQQLKTLDAKLDNVIKAVEQREQIEKAKKVVGEEWETRLRRLSITFGVILAGTTILMGIGAWLMRLFR
jgi:DNA repair exonuclease SbcCD ATPase subunit